MVSEKDTPAAAAVVVTLDVGGRIYKTTDKVIESSGSRILKSLVENGKTSEPLFVDCHPDVFEDILYYMRCKKIRPGTKRDLIRLEELETEAIELKYDALRKEVRGCLIEIHKPKARSHKAILAGDWISGNYNDLEIKFEEGEEDHVVYLVSATITADWPEEDDTDNAPLEKNSTRGAKRSDEIWGTPHTSQEFSGDFPDRFRASFVNPSSREPQSPVPPTGKPVRHSSDLLPIGEVGKSERDHHHNRSGGGSGGGGGGGKVKFFSNLVSSSVSGAAKVVTKVSNSNHSKNSLDPKDEIRRRASSKNSGISNFTLHCNYLKHNHSSGDECYYWNDKDMTITTFDVYRQNGADTIDVTKNIGVFLSQQPGFGTLSLSVSGPGEWELFYWKGPVDKIPIAGVHK